MGSTNAVDIDFFPSDLEFSVFTGDEIKRMSVVKVVTGLTFDTLGHPLPGGLYDSLMGPHGNGMNPCNTCYQLYNCAGHCGHIELSALLYNPFFIKMVHRMLLVSCLHCQKLQIKDELLDLIKLQLALIDAGYIIEAQELELYKSEVVTANSEQQVKQENGASVPVRVAELQQLLFNATTAHTTHSTKTTCALRSAVVNAAMQRPSFKKCIYCRKNLRTVRYVYRKLFYFVPASELEESTSTTGKNKVIFADECRKYLREIYEKYADVLKLIFPILQMSKSVANGQCPMDMFFIDTVLVTPPNTRPVRSLRNMLVEHPQTGLYRRIIENNGVLRVVMKHIKGHVNDLSKEANAVYVHTKGSSAYEKLYNAWEELQTSVDALLDSKVERFSNAQGLKQILEKKEGLIRKHMMGKRVNFAARTVITPDPNINVDEIGMPDIFARKLSYPVPVTPWNVTDLRKMVINGPEGYPGANFIEDEKGHTILIPANDRAKRESIAKLLFNYPKNGIKTVHRHVLNGDVLLLNRQPSLHKCSIMAHKARILPGEKTFRMHYSNCKAYNADFDGDEMNAHLPQSELARAEAYTLANVANNYLVGKDGTPLGGLIQDHVISGVKLSIRGRFFNRDDYQQLVYQGLSQMTGNIKLLPPTIIKPFKLWSGKQIISTILINIIPEGYERISLITHAKVSPKQWQVNNARTPNCAQLSSNELDMSESAVIIRQAELLCGVLDKQQYGATSYSLVHCMYELYGGDVSTRFLTALTKVFTVFLQREGFTLGVKDILVTAEADKIRRKIIKECRQTGDAIAAAALNLPEDTPLDVIAEKMDEAYAKDPQFRILLDRKYKSMLDNYTNDINKTCLPNGLISKFPDNNLQLMVLSGAKGSLVNTMQISCLLGQIELEGKRPPLMISGKSLPSFPAFETSPKSGGFIDGRFMTGIQPQDFFFHCMAGREGLIDTAVKTSRSGYLQRCLIKHLEGLTVHYDLTVRDSDNSVVQFLYGEDGLDVLKCSFFASPIGRQFLSFNKNVILRAEDMKNIKDEVALSKVSAHVKQIHSWRKKHKQTSKNKVSAFTQFSAELHDELEVANAQEINAKTGRRRLDEAIIKLWRKADDESKELYLSKYKCCADPTTAVFKQDHFYGSISERLQEQLDQLNAPAKTKKQKNETRDVFYIKNIKALASPGEPVGLLAAQSIGEPSTQMTLNTFHFAGRGEMNVTLGIPRLREILMMASVNIKTPSMDIPIKAEQLKAAEKLRIKLNRVTVSDVLQYVNVKVKLVLRPERAHQYKVHFQFLPRQAYEQDFCVRPKHIIKYMSHTFFKLLFRAITKAGNKNFKSIEIDDQKPNKKNKKQKDADENADDADEDFLDNDRTQANDKAKNAINVDDDSSDEEAGDDDNDATGIKLKTRKQDETEYDDPEEAEELQDAAADDELDLDDSNADARQENEDEEQVNDEANDDKLIESVLSNQDVSNFNYDKEHYLWCQLTFNVVTRYNRPDLTNIIRELAAKSVLHEVDQLKRAIIYKGDYDVPLLKTDGINIVEMFKYDKTLDINRLYSNDIHGIAKTYGIEAAAQVIIREVQNVFKVYGIVVNRRHLSLIADYMTFDGTFQPMSRKGLEHSASPLQQMSFESCLTFLKNAASSGRADQLQTPSSRLMVGLPVRTGTGVFDMLTKITL